MTREWYWKETGYRTTNINKNWQILYPLDSVAATTKAGRAVAAPAKNKLLFNEIAEYLVGVSLAQVLKLYTLGEIIKFSL